MPERGQTTGRRSVPEPVPPTCVVPVFRRWLSGRLKGAGGCSPPALPVSEAGWVSDRTCHWRVPLDCQLEGSF